MPDEKESKNERAADSGIVEDTKPAGPVKKAKEPSTASNQELFDIDVLADENGLPDWEKAALFRAAEWVKGRQVSRESFNTALETFKARRMGGGRI